jgi:hypothetical protein
MCPKSTTTAKRKEKLRKVNRRNLLSQTIRAKRKGNPVCPEKKRSFPVKIPLKTSLLKNGELITICVGKALICVRITKTDLIKVKRAALFMANGI